MLLDLRVPILARNGREFYEPTPLVRHCPGESLDLALEVAGIARKCVALDNASLTHLVVPIHARNADQNRTTGGGE
jgi:hypothetical protein